MLFGTPLLFRVAYFFTSFAPSLLLIEFKSRKLLGFTFLRFSGYLIILVSTLIIIFISALFIKLYLKHAQEDSSNRVKNMVLNFTVKEKDCTNGYTIQTKKGVKVNSGFISFVTSIVAPSIVFDFLKNAQMILAFVIIFMFFLLMMMSNDVFPNVVLPIFGVQLMVTPDNYNIFYFSKNVEILSGVKRLNTIGIYGSMARTFIITNVEVSDEELKDEVYKW